MRQVQVWLPEETIKKLDRAVEKGCAGNRNLAIRDAIRDYLKELGLW